MRAHNIPIICGALEAIEQFWNRPLLYGEVYRLVANVQNTVAAMIHTGLLSTRLSAVLLKCFSSTKGCSSRSEICPHSLDGSSQRKDMPQTQTTGQLLLGLGSIPNRGGATFCAARVP